MNAVKVITEVFFCNEIPSPLANPFAMIVYDPKRLFSVFDKLLHRKTEPKLPDSVADESLANAFGDYFIEKVTTIREELQEKRGYYRPRPSRATVQWLGV